MQQLFREFLGGPVVRILCFHCRRHGFDTWFLVKELRLHMPPSAAKKQKKKVLMCTAWFISVLSGTLYPIMTKSLS